MDKKKLIPIAAVLIVAVLGGYFSYQQYRSTNSNELELSGIIEAKEIDLSSQVSAPVKKVLVSENDQVKKGQTLVILDNKLLKEQVNQAKAGVDAANALVDDASNESSAKQETADAQLKQAQASLEMAKTQESYTKIKAPISGTIISVAVKEGESVMPSNTIVTIADTSKLTIDVYIPEPNMGQVMLGEKGKLFSDSYPGNSFSAKLVEIANQPEFTPSNIQTKDERVKTVYRASLDIENKSRKLKPGMPADITLKLYK